MPQYRFLSAVSSLSLTSAPNRNLTSCRDKHMGFCAECEMKSQRLPPIAKRTAAKIPQDPEPTDMVGLGPGSGRTNLPSRNRFMIYSSRNKIQQKNGLIVMMRSPF